MENYQENKKDIAKSLGKGLLISFLITVGSLLIFSILLTYTNIGENTITPVIIIVTSISILIGSSIENKKEWYVKWSINWRKLYINIILNIKYFKYAI